MLKNISVTIIYDHILYDILPTVSICVGIPMNYYEHLYYVWVQTAEYVQPINLEFILQHNMSVYSGSSKSQHITTNR